MLTKNWFGTGVTGLPLQDRILNHRRTEKRTLAVELAELSLSEGRLRDFLIIVESLDAYS